MIDFNKLLLGLNAGSNTPLQTTLDLGKIEGGGLIPKEYLNKGGKVFKPPSTANRLLGRMAMGDKALGVMKNSSKVAGRAVPLFIALDAATELTDKSEPFQKNLAEGLGEAGGTLGGLYTGAAMGTPLGPWGSGIGAVLGAILMSEAGKSLAGGAYEVINPDGMMDHYKKKLQRQAELEREADKITRELAMERVRDQQSINLENAMINTIMGR